MQTKIKKIINWFKQNDRILYIEYSLLSLAVIAPLLKPGYILLLDLIFTPNYPKPTELTNNYVLFLSFHYLSQLITTHGLEKVLFFLILFLSGMGMHKLVDTKSKWPKYFTGILYMFNPFVYSRFLFGHLLLLLAYALTPFFLRSLLSFLKKPALKKSIRVAIWAVLIGYISLHSVFFLFLISFVFGAAYLLSNRKNKKYLFDFLKYTSLAGLIFFALNSFWITPYTAGKSKASQVAAGFDTRHVEGFQTAVGEKLSAISNTAAMYGFWGDRENRYIVQKDINPLWFPLFLIILGLAVWGFAERLKKDKANSFAFAVTGFLALVFAVGVAHPLTAKVYWFLYENIPLFKGYREPQKFVALLVLSYAYLGAFGVNAILEKTETLKGTLRRISSFTPAVLLLIPLLYSPVMLWGFGGQVKPVDYPKDWYATNEELNADTEEFEVLFLPWHQYMGFLFAGRVIANPAQRFFDKPIIQGDNAEFGTIYTQNDNPTSDFIEKNILKNKSGVSAIGQKLNEINVKYIILAKEVDWKNYDFLDNQKDLQLIKDTVSLKIYKNLIYKDESKN